MVATERYRAGTAVRRSLYAGFSTTHGLMIDMTLINQAQFAPSIGGGIRNVNLYSALQAADAT